MSKNITISLSQAAYNRIEHWAKLRQQDIDTVISDWLNDAMSPLDNLTIPPAESDPAVERERAAYLRMHPDLQKTHAGQYVAIYNGELVDSDSDEAALFARIDDLYPDKFVWMTRIEDVPEKEIVLRSPRFTPEMP